MKPQQHTWSASPTAEAALSPFDAVIFDLDGVITDTAEIHSLAWKELFDSVLQDPRAGAAEGEHRFTDSDYRRFVDGRPREEGVRTFLKSRGISVPEGAASDPPGAWSVNGLSRRKNDIFNQKLKNGRVTVFPSSVYLLKRLHAGGVPVVLATSSRNARVVLERAGLLEMFDVLVDGNTAAELELPGKPDPALFLEAARRTGVPAARTALIEDAVAGVQAGRAGGFGLVVGIDRTDRRAELEAAGADIVLNDLGEFDIGRVLTHPWLLIYDGMDPAHEGHREALTTLGNGYMAVRGAAPECDADGVHYPGTYMAGIYNRLTSSVHGQQSMDEHMVNVPNWLPLDLAVGTGKWWSAGGLRLRSEHRELDLRRAILSRFVVLECDDGRRLEVAQRRLVSAGQVHLAALETTLTAQGWSGDVVLRLGLDTGVTNSNVPADSLLAHRHLRTLFLGTSENDVDSAEVETRNSHIRIAVSARIHGHGLKDSVRRDRRLSRDLVLDLKDGVPAAVCKIVAVVTSRDTAISSPHAASLAVLARAPVTFEQILAAHERTWRGWLAAFALELDTDRQTQLILNLHIFHVLQTLTPHLAELDAGVPARGLHGEGYRGHVFWDELFVLPVLTSRLPVVARSVLDYRWRRLEAAQDAARHAGLRGAMYPWQSGSDGQEETPHWDYNPRLKDWSPDYSSLQRHSGLAVAYNAWQYFEATGDHDWLIRRGAEILIEVVRFFASLAVHDPQTDRFHITGVMGPDEYHTGYPDRPEPGLDDNAYTNVMAAWLCATTWRLMTSVLHGQEQQDLAERLQVRQDELDGWEHIGHRMYVPFHSDGIISQFQGYEQLKELDWEHYQRNYGNIERLDLILQAAGDTPNRYRLAKQADVLMLLYLLGEEQLIGFLANLGYPVDRPTLGRTVDFYLARTAHGSTLSRVAHASVLAAMDPERAWSTFREALDADLDDTQGGTTRAGIHLGAMAGSIDTVQRSFAGLRMSQDELVFTPRLPTGLRSVRFNVRYRSQQLEIALDHERLTVAAAPGAAPPVRVRVGRDTVMLHAGQAHGFLARPSS
jgi:beta-phosphoglucomutase family hydrolase